MHWFSKPITIFALLAFSTLAIPSTAPAMLLPWGGKVVEVLSGDLLVVTRGDKLVNVRLAEIDSPEPKQPFGPEARDFTLNKCLNREVTVTPRTQGGDDRIVGYVQLSDGEKLHLLLLKNGLAWQYKRYSQTPLLEALESEARQKKLGLWSQPNPTPPWEFRSKRTPDSDGGKNEKNTKAAKVK